MDGLRQGSLVAPSFRKRILAVLHQADEVCRARTGSRETILDAAVGVWERAQELEGRVHRQSDGLAWGLMDEGPGEEGLLLATQLSGLFVRLSHICVARLHPPPAPGPTSPCLPWRARFRLQWETEEEEVRLPPLPYLLLPQLQLFGSCLRGSGSGAVTWFSWCPCFRGLSLEKRTDFLRACGSSPFFLAHLPNQPNSE